jgi:DNA adenine methylase
VIRENAARADTVFFIDPPYTADGKKPGNRLYACSEVDHEELFRIASTISGDFLMTYDNVEGVHLLAANYGLDTEPVAMKNTHHAKMTELLIGRNLDWMR